MIDEKRLIEEIKMTQNFVRKVYGEKVAIEANEVLKLFVELVESQKKVSEWIPVFERLPEKYKDVLVSFGDEPDIEPVIAWYSDIHKTWHNSGTAHKITAKVKAWMPLPEPYHEPELIGPMDALQAVILNTFLRTE